MIEKRLKPEADAEERPIPVDPIRDGCIQPGLPQLPDAIDNAALPREHERVETVQPGGIGNQDGFRTGDPERVQDASEVSHAVVQYRHARRIRKRWKSRVHRAFKGNPW